MGYKILCYSCLGHRYSQIFTPWVNVPFQVWEICKECNGTGFIVVEGEDEC